MEVPIWHNEKKLMISLVLIRCFFVDKGQHRTKQKLELCLEKLLSQFFSVRKRQGKRNSEMLKIEIILE